MHSRAWAQERWSAAKSTVFRGKQRNILWGSLSALKKHNKSSKPKKIRFFCFVWKQRLLITKVWSRDPGWPPRTLSQVPGWLKSRDFLFLAPWGWGTTSHRPTRVSWGSQSCCRRGKQHPADISPGAPIQELESNLWLEPEPQSKETCFLHFTAKFIIMVCIKISFSLAVSSMSV